MAKPSIATASRSPAPPTPSSGAKSAPMVNTHSSSYCIRVAGWCPATLSPRRLATTRYRGTRHHYSPTVSHKVFAGNQPSTTLLLPRLDPYHLGLLLALYEHKVFVQGVIWGINSFDQWDVELGKQLASRVLPVLHGDAPNDSLDVSTRGLIDWTQSTHG